VKVAVVGAGWAGLSAAVTACAQGHAVTVFEAARSLGGRARSVQVTLPDGHEAALDNGQHILIGAYTETLRMMRMVDINPDTVLKRMPLDLRFVDGSGLTLPDAPAPLDAIIGIAGAQGWTWADKWSLVKAATRWQWQGFVCSSSNSVQDLCAALTPRVIKSLIEPLCVSALNTPAARASGQVFLTVLRDSLFAAKGGSNLLLPMAPLGRLFPEQAARWLQARGSSVHLGHRVNSLQWTGGWQVDGEPFDAVVWATDPTTAQRSFHACASDCDQPLPEQDAQALLAWAAVAGGLHHESIATIYAWDPSARLTQPMIALPSTEAHPAQFVFDRGQLGGHTGLLAFVVSASTSASDALQQQVLDQARRQLGLQLQGVKTIVEKRATFACTPGLVRPNAAPMQNLYVCGDYVDGPYPATLEAAVRSGIAAGQNLCKHRVHGERVSVR
jgi:squalene-associated FAD-dependent desaturase